MRVRESFSPVLRSLIPLGMRGESAHIIFKAVKTFQISCLEGILILCALLHLRGIRAQTLAWWLGKDRGSWGPKTQSEVIDI